MADYSKSLSEQESIAIEALARVYSVKAVRLFRRDYEISFSNYIVFNCRFRGLNPCAGRSIGNSGRSQDGSRGSHRKDGFRLAENAKKVIGLGVEPLAPLRTKFLKVLLSIMEIRSGVYRLRDGWFKLVEIQKISDSNSETTISSSDLKTSDQIAVEGVALLRVSDMDAFGGEQ